MTTYREDINVTITDSDGNVLEVLRFRDFIANVVEEVGAGEFATRDEFVCVARDEFANTTRHEIVRFINREIVS